MLSYWTEQVSIFSSALEGLITSLNEEIGVYSRNSQKDSMKDREDYNTLKVVKAHLQIGLDNLVRARVRIVLTRDVEEVFKETQGET